MQKYNALPDFSTILVKAQKYCLYRERSEFEMDRKMREWGVSENLRNKALNELIASKFVSNVRFTDAYVRGKFSVKSWGRIKIRQGLRLHQISEIMINEAFSQIDEDLYVSTLDYLLHKKMPKDLHQMSMEEGYKTKASIYRYALQKGYESNLIISVLNKYFKALP